MRFFTRVFSLITGLLLPTFASAHEVYVLPAKTVQQALTTPAFSAWQVIFQNIDQFFLWAFIAALVVFVVFFISISRSLERLLDPFLAKLPPYAPVVSRVTIGLSFLAGAQYQALFGPELPLRATFGGATTVVTALLVSIGVLIIIGWYTRIAALVATTLFAIEVYAHGSYLLTYTNYLGELVLLLVFGAHALALHTKRADARLAPRWLLWVKRAYAPYAFMVLRVAFGISLFYASLYAKVLHNNLALNVAYAYPQILHFFGFEAHFLVLGASIIEMLIATFFILGIEIRFTALFLLFWLSLSLWYFGEVVWPHLILIGIPIALIFYGYDAYSLEGRFFKRDGREPVL